MKIIKYKMKEEKASITLFVLIACIFIVISLVVANTGILNKRTSQEREMKKITQNYSNNESQMNKIYSNIIEE